MHAADVTRPPTDDVSFMQRTCIRGIAVALLFLLTHRHVMPLRLWLLPVIQARRFFSQVWVTKLMNLPARLRFQLFQSSILSTPYFAGESWHTPAGRQLGCLRKALHRMVSKL